MAIVAALVILTLLAIISFSASRVANNEVTMARNESVHQRNLYLAEGAAMEAVDRLVNTANLKDNVPAWMEKVAGSLDVDTLRKLLERQGDRPTAGIRGGCEPRDVRRRRGRRRPGRVPGHAHAHGLYPRHLRALRVETASPSSKSATVRCTDPKVEAFILKLLQRRIHDVAIQIWH